MEARSNKLQAKDLINVGIFTAIYFVIFFAGMMLGYIPIFIPLLGLVCPILCGIPFMLYLTKVKKFGMVSLTGIILGLLNVLIGAGVLVLIFGVVFGILGDLVLKAGKYQSWKCTLLGNGVIASFIPAAPFMIVGGMLPSLLTPGLTAGLTAIGAPQFVIGLVCDVGVDVQRGGRRHMTQHSGERFHIHAVLQRQGRERMPLRYNYDKPGKP